MNQDHSKLIEYLDGKFGEVNTRIDKFETKFNQLVDSIDKLTKKIGIKLEY